MEIWKSGIGLSEIKGPGNALIIGGKAKFYHVQKTGGTAIFHMTKHLGHEFLDELHAYPTSKVDNSFCFIRDPAEWLKSIWSFWKDMPIRVENTRRYVDNSPRSNLDTTFSGEMLEFFNPDDFVLTVEKYLENHSGFITRLYKTYALKCSYVGRQENLETDLYNILTLCGVKLWNKDLEIFKSFRGTNTSSSKDVHFPKELKDLIHKSEEEIYRIYYRR